LAIYNAGTKAIEANALLTTATLDALATVLNDRIVRLESQRNIMLAGVLLAIAAAAYALIAFFLASQSGFKGITKRISKLGAGDLSGSRFANGRDEVSEAINVFRDSVLSLAGIVKGVRESAESISMATSEIAAGNNDLAQRGARIANTVQETSENMTSLAEKISHNLDNAKQANQLAVSAFEAATDGEKVVSQAVTMMNKITASSRKIADITEVINGIAFQTNILALNAAVEAARAGEQGRGFAVVATEVRNLAHRSASAAKEIEVLIGDSLQDISGGARFVNAAGTSMTEILGSVQRVTLIMEEITLASNQQSGEINVMASAVREVDASTQENAAMVEEIAAAVMSLEERANFLSGSVRSFRIDEDVAAISDPAAALPPKQTRELPRMGMRALPKLS
jgi:methyl-accepting chemotaxis protein